VPARTRLADDGEVRGGIVGITDCDHSSVDVGRQRIDSIEDRFRYAAGLVDDHQDVASMDALEGSRVIVGRLAAVRHELITDVPLGIEGDAPRQASLLVGVAHVPPEDRLDLRSRRCRGDDEGLSRRMHIDPPQRQPRHRVRLRNIMRRLEGAVAVLDHRARHAVLARPPELAQG
jgi:hypothetical protein